ncbi:MAG: HEAT repeat domain-containing protein [Planctomycetota bacterium]|jgi:HEAT repeat protein
MKKQRYRTAAILGCLTGWIILAVPSARLQPLAVGQGSVNLGSEQAYIAILKSGASVYDKAAACRQLALVGTRRSVDVLEGLLHDEVLGDYARLALEPIEDPAVDRALRRALDRLEGKSLAGVINSIGARGDAEAVERLSEFAADPESPVACEAVAALGRIATDQACDSILGALASESAKLRTAAADASLAAAEKRREDAARLCDAVRRADVPGHLRASATYGAIMARGSEGTSLLIEQLRTDEPRMVEIALTAARRLQGREVTGKLIDELNTAQPVLQVLLIKVLVDRQDPAAYEAIKTLAASGNLDVGVESLKALGRIGYASAAPVLIEALDAGPERASAALVSLRQLKGRGVDPAIIEAMKTADGNTRIDLIDVLTDRRSGQAVPALLAEAASEDEAVAVASLKALTALARQDDVPELVELLVKARSAGVRTQAENAVVAAAGPGKRTAEILEQLKRVERVELRCSLLRVLGRIGGDRALRALQGALKDADEEIRDTAVRALVAWPDSRALYTLSEISQSTTNNTHRVLALRGYVRLLALDTQLSDKEKVGMYRRAMDMARSADEKKLILAGLAGVAHSDALEIISECAEQWPKEANAAAMRIQKIATDPQVRNQAKKLAEAID